jgi:hypothetical protein
MLKKYWPEAVAIAGSVWVVVGSQVQAVIAAHPVAAFIVSAVSVVVAHLAPSPVKPAASSK